MTGQTLQNGKKSKADFTGAKLEGAVEIKKTYLNLKLEKVYFRFLISRYRK
jgi:hypothetical protein